MPKKKRNSDKEEPKKEEPVEEVSKKQEESENNILKIVLVIAGIIIIFVIAYFVFSSGQNKLYYKGIQFQTEKVGNLTFYDTVTLANSSTGVPFGFRIRTNPNNLQNIPFENVDQFTLMKVNGYSATNHTFSCDGYGVIAMANLGREFSEMGMQFMRDQNATCDPAGRYNFFMIDYGNKTQIKQIGNRCYEIEIRGNDSNCEILPATEKLMVEMYAKYLNLSSGK